MSKLYELTEAYKKVWDMVDDDADLDCIEDTLQAIEGDIEFKAESMAKIIKSIEADEKVIKIEEERLYNRRKSLENQRTHIKSYLEQQLLTMGVDKIKTPTFTIAIQNNPPSVKILDESKIPECYLVEQAPKIDKEAILEHLKSGSSSLVMGCTLEQSKSLRIR